MATSVDKPRIAQIPTDIEVDPVTLDIIEGALKSARFEMDAVLFRSAMSPVIREQHDEFPMITDPKGRMIVGQFGRTHEGHRRTEASGDRRNLLIVGRNEPVGDFARVLRRLDGVGNQRMPTQRIDILTRKALGTAARGNDCENVWR